MLTLLLSGIGAALFAFMATLCAINTWLLAFFLSFSTLLCLILGNLRHNFTICFFFINLFAVMAAGIDANLQQAIQRIYMILLGTGIAEMCTSLWITQSPNYFLQSPPTATNTDVGFNNAFSHIKNTFHWQSITLHHALRAALAMFIAVLIYRNFSFTHGFWIPLTVIITLQATLSATLRKGVPRLLGSALGILIGSSFYVLINNPQFIDALLIISIFVAYSLKTLFIKNNKNFVILLIIIALFFIAVLVPGNTHSFILARLYDTGIGAIIGLACSAVLFPTVNNL